MSAMKLMLKILQEEPDVPPYIEVPFILEERGSVRSLNSEEK